MRALRLLLVIAFAATLAACASTKHPVGISAGPQSNAALAGTWIGVDPDHPANRFYVFVFPAAQGTTTMSALMVMPVGGQEKPGWESFDVVVGKVGKTGYINIRAVLENGKPTHDDDHSYAPATYRIEGDRIVLRGLDYNKVHDAIANGQIAGDGAIISAAPEALDAYFAAHAEAVLSDKTTVLTRQK